jgi:DinB superfamily
MNSQLRRISIELDAASDRLHRLITDMPERVWTTRPGNDAWSVAECIEHLNLTSRAFIPRLQQAVASAGIRADARRYRRDPIGWIIALSSGPMMRLGRWRLGRVRTTPAFVPAVSPPLDATVAEFDALQNQLRQILRDADGRSIDAVKVASPFDARLSYSAFSALVIIPRHQMRHLDQAEESARIAGAFR